MQGFADFCMLAEDKYLWRGEKGWPPVTAQETRVGVITARTGLLGIVICITIVSGTEAKSPGEVKILLEEHEFLFLGAER